LASAATTIHVAMAEPFQLTTDDDLLTAVRDAVSYDDTPDELPQTQLEGLLNDAKRDMYIKTGSKGWYDDVAYGQALKGWTQILSKAAVENINIASYSIADEEISLRNADPDSSQQIQLWMEQVNMALDKSELPFERYENLSLKNTTDYIGN